MQRRLTQLFPNLLGRPAVDLEEANQILERDEEVDRATEEQLAELREQTEDIYNRKYWTRVIDLQTFVSDEL